MAQRVGLGLSLAERKSEDALTTITAAATNSVERRQCSARERSKKACGLYVQRVRLRLSQSRHAASSPTNSISSKKRRTTRKTCAPCKAKARTCSASLPCQECVAAGEATSCHYRGGLRLNALKRPDDARVAGSSRGLKATRLIAPSPSPARFLTSPASVEASSRQLRVPDRPDNSSPANSVTGSAGSGQVPAGWEPLQQTADPTHLFLPSPLDTLARIAQEAALQKSQSIGSLASWSNNANPCERGYGSTNPSPTHLRTSDQVGKTANDDPVLESSQLLSFFPFSDTLATRR